MNYDQLDDSLYGNKVKTPEQRLWYAVIVRAVYDCVGVYWFFKGDTNKSVTKREIKKLKKNHASGYEVLLPHLEPEYEEALQFFLDNSDEYKAICQVAEIDSEALRDTVLELHNKRCVIHKDIEGAWSAIKDDPKILHRRELSRQATLAKKRKRDRMNRRKLAQAKKQHT